MPLNPLVGHDKTRERLSRAVAAGTLPASLLLHGPAGSGKERLALWLGQRLLCEAPDELGEPCGACQSCRYAVSGAHPDLHWYFPRPRLKASDPDTDDVIGDLAEGIADRLAEKGAWAPPAATDSIYVATVRALVSRASLTPAMARRKIIVVADAERMVPQEGSDQAANTFLKLLEEPLANTTVILTTSAVGALIPTVRSRVVAVRVPPLDAAAVRERAAQGLAPRATNDVARDAAAALLTAATQDAAARYRMAFRQGGRGARGNFSEMLDALTELLHDRARTAAGQRRDAAALGAARAVQIVEQAKALTRQNVNPQLISANLLRELAPHVSAS